MSVLSFNGCCIVEDHIAYAIRDPKPCSVSKFLKYIDDNYPTQENKDMITEIHLANNSISCSGAIQILEYILTNLHNIRKLDISHNRIYKSDYEHKLFNEKLLQVLSLETIEKVYVTKDEEEIDYVQKSIDEHLKIKNIV